MGIKRLAASAAIAGALATGAMMGSGTANADIVDGARVFCKALDANPTISNIWKIRTEMYEAGKGEYFSPVVSAAKSVVCPWHHDLIIAWSYDGWV